jgi:hypothetical protein
MRLVQFLTLLLLGCGMARAADPGTFDTLPEPPAPVKDYKRPAPPAAAASDESALPEPEVTITTQGEARHEEYRIGGRLYMIKVIPKKGPPYYLIDPNGSGVFLRSDLAPDVSPPMWVIKQF